ncbi:MAG: zinc-finger domain-containing protein [Candidatus Liberibacter ctenarytainae]|uniref:Zinc-finger domain-containing protein n=1 Tax=Candidatus Liberibacter ctenarytainae TaxID=2020335 RepID=A0A937AME8_9HYPH|nr:zinc-finger domain-containing protein [Candidatus Liberibacter ctenarytainae]
MSQSPVLHFQNDKGYHHITIGVKTFMCAGASPPLDHPHVFINMGDKNEKYCPYCSTLYQFNESLDPEETRPAGCFLSIEG